MKKNTINYFETQQQVLISGITIIEYSITRLHFRSIMLETNTKVRRKKKQIYYAAIGEQQSVLDWGSFTYDV